MPEYVLDRNHSLSTPNGVVSFVKGVPVYVTPNMEKDAIAIGAARADGKKPDVFIEEKPEPILGEDERQTQVFAAFDLIVETNDAKDFTGQGVPRAKSVERLVSFNLEQGELISTWTKYRQAKEELK